MGDDGINEEHLGGAVLWWGWCQVSTRNKNTAVVVDDSGDGGNVFKR